VSEENLEIVERAIAAVNDQDLDAYLACCTDDVELTTPLDGLAGVYQGAEGVRRFFSELGDATPDFKIEIEHLTPVGASRVLAFMRVTATGRSTGIPTATDTGNIYDVEGGRIRRIRIFVDRDEALKAAGPQD
jgi:ketosteroid isomerase-like protein